MRLRSWELVNCVDESEKQEWNLKTKMLELCGRKRSGIVKQKEHGSALYSAEAPISNHQCAVFPKRGVKAPL